MERAAQFDVSNGPGLRLFPCGVCENYAGECTTIKIGIWIIVFLTSTIRSGAVSVSTNERLMHNGQNIIFKVVEDLKQLFIVTEGREPVLRPNIFRMVCNLYTRVYVWYKQLNFMEE